MNLITDIKFAFRSLVRTKGLALTVILTLALGIGANAAIFSVVRGVLLRPLVNRDQDRLIYIRQSALGIGVPNAAFSVPEIRDLQARVKTISAFGDFSTIEFTMLGLGEPRSVRAGVVGGSYFEVMGLRPVLGRLIGPQDDGRNADGVAVLTYRFWTSAFKSDPGVIGKTIRLSDRPATVIGVLEPSVPYPQETEIIANVVTSPHHLDATMVEGRVHRMTELFGRLAPGADLEAARAELRAVHGGIVSEHPESYQKQADFRITARSLRDEIISPARTILLILLAASALVFIVACSNVANLILARSVRREGELAVRAALGASSGALRRTLLAESLLLCGAGAALAVAIARPMVAVLARYAARFSVRTHDVTVDASLLWVGAGLAIAAAVLLAFVPRLPSADAANGMGLASGGARITPGTNRRLRVFAITQIAASFVLVAGAGMLITTLFSLQRQQTGFRGNVLAVNVPVVSYTRKPEEVTSFYREAIRQIAQLPGVDSVALGTVVPWRDPGFFAAQFTAEGYQKANGEEDPRARFRTVSPGFFDALGVRMIAGRDFNEGDRREAEKVVIISESVAKRMFPGMDAVNRRLIWTDPVMKFIDVSTDPRRIVGFAADVDDENLRARAGHDGVSPDGAGVQRRALVHPRTTGSLRARAQRDEGDSGPGQRSAGGTGRDARRHSRGSAGAQPRECARVRRLRRGRAPHRGRGRGRRARVLGERAYPRVRNPARHRIDAQASAGSGPARGRRHRRQRHRRGRDWRCGARAPRRQFHPRRAHSGTGAHRRRRNRARRGGDRRLADAGGTGVAGGRPSRAALRVGMTLR
jgi:predicted permease